MTIAPKFAQVEFKADGLTIAALTTEPVPGQLRRRSGRLSRGPWRSR